MFTLSSIMLTVALIAAMFGGSAFAGDGWRKKGGCGNDGTDVFSCPNGFMSGIMFRHVIHENKFSDEEVRLSCKTYSPNINIKVVDYPLKKPSICAYNDDKSQKYNHFSCHSGDTFVVGMRSNVDCRSGGESESLNVMCGSSPKIQINKSKCRNTPWVENWDWVPKYNGNYCKSNEVATALDLWNKCGAPHYRLQRRLRCCEYSANSAFNETKMELE